MDAEINVPCFEAAACRVALMSVPFMPVFRCVFAADAATETISGVCLHPYTDANSTGSVTPRSLKGPLSSAAAFKSSFLFFLQVGVLPH